MIGVAFASPAPGSSVGRTFTITGTWFDDGTVDNQGHDRFSLLQVLVDFGANRFPKVAATIGDGTWSATGALPAGVRHGDVVTISFDASVLAISSSGDQPGEYDVTDTRQVVVEQTAPQVVIDAFQNEVTVDLLPFRVPLLSGRALDSSGVAGVQFTVDGGARQNMDSITGDPSQVTWSKANLGFGAGRHTVVVIATDNLGNEGTASTTVTVHLNAPPPPPPPPTGDIVFTPTFRHTDWVDNVDRIEAGGPNGFNVRYDAIDGDLRRMSTVVGLINAALRSPGVTPGVQQVSPGLDLMPLPNIEKWIYDDTGTAVPAAAGAQAIMDLTLPTSIVLRSFRAMGLYPGPPAVLAIRLFRSSLLDQSLPPEQLAEIKLDSPGVTNPYDSTVPVPASAAAVDGSFRYYIVVAHLGPPAGVSLATVQLAYLAG